jgi:nucleotide-binding universal stress UspA family protein
MVPKHPDEADLLEKVKGQAEAITADGVDATVESDAVVLGGPAPKIAEIAEKSGADVIVVGSHGHSRLAGVVVGSVAHKLLHVAPCPVLVVPSK